MYPPLACFLADDPDSADLTAPDIPHPVAPGTANTVWVTLPVSLPMLEAACMGPNRVPTDQITAWSDDEMRAWALFELLGPGALRALNTAHTHTARTGWRARSARARRYRLLHARLTQAFGFALAAEQVDAELGVVAGGRR